MKNSLQNPIDRLASVVKALRDPETGCPWDKDQTFDSIARWTVEEAYEIEDAVLQKKYASLKEELGDMLFHILFYADIAEKGKLFTFDDIANAISEKMISRHAHVFKREAKEDWEKLKKEERKKKNEAGVLDGIARTLPPLTRALKLQKRAATVGFDWGEASEIFEKLGEEITELKEAAGENDFDHTEDEMGDVLFVAVNLARKMGIDPEVALRRTNEKFERRFSYIERELKKQGRDVTDATLDEMEALWQKAKKEPAKPRET